MNISRITDISRHSAALCELLSDSVESGASVGFVLPINHTEIQEYWQGVADSLSSNHQLFVATNDNGAIIGSVQIEIPTKANGSHRAEVQKLMVHTSAQGQGVAKALMQHIEDAAKSLEVTLLVLDTRLGDTASYLYRKVGYIEAGQIPHFAKNSEGGFDATVYFYKLI